MEYAKPAVEALKPYDLSASKLIKGFGLAGTIGALLVGFVLFLATLPGACVTWEFG